MSNNNFELLKKEVEAGIVGVDGLPMGFKRLNHHISIRKSLQFLLGGYTGSGKTSLLDDAFVLNPLDYLLTQKPLDIDMHIIYWSMERRKNFKLAKWICRKIFLDHQIIIPLNRMMGWVSKTERLTMDEHDLFLLHEDYINALMEKVTIIEGPQNPMGIKKFVDDFADKNGTKEGEGFNKIYVPHNPNQIVEIVYDHIGLLKKEKRKDVTYNTKKEIIDLTSEDARHFRDFYGYTPIMVSQFNRDIANPTRIKSGDVEPMLEDFKDSGGTQEDADVVLSLFDPMRYKVSDPGGYDLDKLRDESGMKKYRSLKILKNSYGSDDIRVGLAFQPEIGLFKEMPKQSQITERDYQMIKENTFFIQ